MSSSQSTKLHAVHFVFEKNGAPLVVSWPTEEIRRLRFQYQVGEPNIWIYSGGIIRLDKVLFIQWPENADTT